MCTPALLALGLFLSLGFYNPLYLLLARYGSSLPQTGYIPVCALNSSSTSVW